MSHRLMRRHGERIHRANQHLQWRPLGCLLVCLALASLVFESCYGGLNPADYAQRALLSGRVHFLRGGGSEHFPLKDSLLDLRVAAFKEIPRDTNVINALVNGEAFFSATLVDSTFPAVKDFQLEIPQKQLADSSITLKYIAVAQQYGPNSFYDWRVVGVFCVDSLFTPMNLRVVPGQVRNDLDINVDFLHLPPQPFIR